MSPRPSASQIVIELHRRSTTDAFHYYHQLGIDEAIQVSVALATRYFTEPPRRLRITIEAVE